MYKTIIPGLLTFDTSQTKLVGSYLIRNFNFFSDSSRPALHHYKVLQTEKIEVPKNFEFRNGYYLYSGGKWFYERKIIGGLKLKFSFEPASKEFRYNRLYGLMPFEVGGTLPVGRHITDIVGLNLALDGYVLLRGFAYRHNGQVQCAVAPSLNGKTTMMQQILENGGQYIAEDSLIMKKNMVFPTAAISSNFGRSINAELEQNARAKHITNAVEFSKLIFFFNSTEGNGINLKASFEDYLAINSLNISDNKFLRSYMFLNGLSEQLLTGMRSAKTVLPKVEIMQFKNFDYSNLVGNQASKNTEHWDELGSNYRKVWKSEAKKWLSKAEMQFVAKYAKGGSTILDVGVGNGRIIETILESAPRASVYAIDTAESMVKFSKNKFGNDKRVKELTVHDLSVERVPFGIKFDRVTSIRVVKYNAQWQLLVERMMESLTEGGILIFSVANGHSLNRLSRYPIPTYKTYRSEIRRLAKRLNAEVLEISGQTRIPDVAYDLRDSNSWHNFIVGSEKLGNKVFGQARFTRELFVALKKKDS